MTSEPQQPEQTSRTGKPMVPATPRDVVHIRIGSFGLIAALAIAVLAFVVGIPWLAVVMAVLAVVVAVDMVLAIRRQNQNRRMHGGMTEAG
ncbi:DUF6343 family protein [Planomonospora venezuelensis]|uniref:Flp pilus assembly protein TadB n=1 Tax=Planomonospora venezuelensis TaxID=1999 RepID=A0A841DE28_PLAVE|nr:DUF6343 family protein [Planomonospora venezuelensis]MBB5966345.1 Flp pilus assembly protein TadB [Planomonospora venezuelensis]GIM99752.1 hypothetical protein Pve01_14110 [Planomonospora venezuelensis]